MSTQPIITGVKAQAYINASYEREERNAWYVMSPKVGRPEDHFGSTHFSRLFGISVKHAQRHRDELLRLPLMKPEARRLTVRMVMFG